MNFSLQKNVFLQQRLLNNFSLKQNDSGTDSGKLLGAQAPPSSFRDSQNIKKQHRNYHICGEHLWRMTYVWCFRQN